MEKSQAPTGKILGENRHNRDISDFLMLCKDHKSLWYERLKFLSGLLKLSSHHIIMTRWGSKSPKPHCCHLNTAMPSASTQVRRHLWSSHSSSVKCGWRWDLRKVLGFRWDPARKKHSVVSSTWKALGGWEGWLLAGAARASGRASAVWSGSPKFRADGTYVMAIELEAKR